MARDPEQELAAARSRYEANDLNGSLRRLDRARGAFTKRGDTDGLRRVLQFAELSEMRDERGGAARDNLVYAVKQNLRGTTRRQALRAKEPWTDPYPDLAAPQEHTRIPITRGLKFWIGVGVVLGMLAVAAYVAAIVVAAIWGSSGDQLALRVRNDLGQTVDVKWCTNPHCSTSDFDPTAGQVFSSHTVDPGLSFEEDLPANDVADLFVVYANGERLGCLPVRVDAAYHRLRDKNGEVTVAVSRMTPCPGRIVMPTLPQEANAA